MISRKARKGAKPRILVVYISYFLIPYFYFLIVYFFATKTQRHKMTRSIFPSGKIVAPRIHELFYRGDSEIAEIVDTAHSSPLI